MSLEECFFFFCKLLDVFLYLCDVLCSLFRVLRHFFFSYYKLTKENFNSTENKRFLEIAEMLLTHFFVGKIWTFYWCYFVLSNKFWEVCSYTYLVFYKFLFISAATVGPATNTKFCPLEFHANINNSTQNKLLSMIITSVSWNSWVEKNHICHHEF